MVYLTARSMAIDSSTRDYLKNVEDKNGFKLPKGPLFMSPKPLAEAFTLNLGYSKKRILIYDNF